jgi:hypothetical protein
MSHDFSSLLEDDLDQLFWTVALGLAEQLRKAVILVAHD